MGVSIVHGRILMEYGSEENFREIISSLGLDEYYPFLSSHMFSGAAEIQSQFYDQQVIAFAATYKNVEYGYGFHVFILKFEKLLRQLAFDTAHIELETELMGTYRFFWKKIREPDTIKDRYQDEDFQLIRTDEWYFGFGYRNDYGSLVVKLEEAQIYPADDFAYPISIPENLKMDLQPLINGIEEKEVGKKFYVKEFMKNQGAIRDKLYFYLSSLQIEHKIDFTFEGEKGYSITKLT